MNNKTLLQSVKEQLIKRSEANSLDTHELIEILSIETEAIKITQLPQCTPCDEQEPTPEVEFEPEKDCSTPCDEQAPTPEVEFEPEKDCSTPCDEQEPTPEVEEKKLTSTEKFKLEISEKIIQLGGTPPEKGSLKKFKDALEALETKEEQEVEDPPAEPEDSETEEEETDEDIDKFNEVMVKIQDLYDDLEERGIVKNMSTVTDLTIKIDPDAKSPNELNIKGLKKLLKRMKKLDE